MMNDFNDSMGVERLHISLKEHGLKSEIQKPISSAAEDDVVNIKERNKDDNLSVTYEHGQNLEIENPIGATAENAVENIKQMFKENNSTLNLEVEQPSSTEEDDIINIKALYQHNNSSATYLFRHRLNLKIEKPIGATAEDAAVIKHIFKENNSGVTDGKEHEQNLEIEKPIGATAEDAVVNIKQMYQENNSSITHLTGSQWPLPGPGPGPLPFADPEPCLVSRPMVPHTGLKIIARWKPPYQRGTSFVAGAGPLRVPPSILNKARASRGSESEPDYKPMPELKKQRRANSGGVASAVGAAGAAGVGGGGGLAGPFDGYLFQMAAACGSTAAGY